MENLQCEDSVNHFRALQDNIEWYQKQYNIHRNTVIGRPLTKCVRIIRRLLNY